ncbi:MAG: sulfatase [Planctomycetota bacterium]|nr:MAG: sulfatase [Planctomycetota bacterium]
MSKQPNILFIMSDDHAANAISAYGSKINSTPNIDRIANDGMKLDHCYVTNSICTPSRAAILTGTHNHINRVTTLNTHIDNRLPNVAKHLKQGGYQTAMVGKWHLGTGPKHCPTGFDYWSVLPGQGIYHKPVFHEMGEVKTEEGYVTDIITDKCLNWLDKRDTEKPFFLMCHHKAPHRPFDPKPEHRQLYNNMDIPIPETFDDDYANRAKAAAEAKMRISEDLSYVDLDLVKLPEHTGKTSCGNSQSVPFPKDLTNFYLRCALTGEKFTFKTQDELKKWKYQRYIRKYLQTVHSIDENVGRMLDYLDENNLTENTIVIYTSDQGFYLGEHGWFDKRFIYEESFQMPFLIKYPKEIKAGSVNKDMTCNVDFAPTWLDYAGLKTPNYMQGESFRNNLQGNTPKDWTDVAYHRYWMNQDDCHNAYAHYGIRTDKYKLIYWYNEDLGEDGARPADFEEKEWELFDLEKDPLELFNVYNDPAYSDIIKETTEKLNAKMLAIGDIPEHELV